MHLLFPLVLSALLFSLGVYGVLARRNVVLVLMSVELMLNAVNLDLVAFDVYLRDLLHAGQSLALFVITIAAAEVGLGLAIVLQVFRQRATVAVDALDELAEPDTVTADAVPLPVPTGPPAGAVPAGAVPAGAVPVRSGPARSGAAGAGGPGRPAAADSAGQP